MFYTRFCQLTLLLIFVTTTAFAHMGDIPRPVKGKNFGELRWIATNSMHAAKTLSELGLGKDFFALGMTKGLDAELLVLNGKPYLGRFRNFKYEASTAEGNLPVSFLAYARVAKWKTLSETNNVKSFEDIERSVFRAVGDDRPVPVRVIGKVRSLRWFVVGGMGNLSPKPVESFMRNRILGGLDDVEIECFGIYSRNHQGIMTSPGQNLHLHFRTTDGAFVGHIDNEVTFAEPPQILVPK